MVGFDSQAAHAMDKFSATLGDIISLRGSAPPTPWREFVCRDDALRYTLEEPGPGPKGVSIRRGALPPTPQRRGKSSPPGPPQKIDTLRTPQKK